MTGGHPLALPSANHTAPVPRRIRAVLNGRVVVDTISALYVWEWSHYPQYYIPVGDIDPVMLVYEQHEQKLSRATARRYALQVGEIVGRPRCGSTATTPRWRDWPAGPGSSGIPWMPGSRRTSRSLSIPATPTPASTRV